MNTARRIRICERDSNRFEVAVIDDDTRQIHNQGPAHNATTPEQAYKWALGILPDRVLNGAKWEYRSVHGVYADLDIARLGW